MNAIQNKIYTDGEYLEKNHDWGREDSFWKAAIIDKLIRKNNPEYDSIIEVGCGFGEILVHLADFNKQINIFKGYDISPQAIKEAKKKENDRVRFYLDDFVNSAGSEKALILVIDVVEHIQDYIQFLRDIIDKGECFIFHIPLDLSCRTIFKSHVILQQRNDVGHIHYFTREIVQWVLNDCGYTIVDWEYTFSETDRHKPHSFKQWAKKNLRRFSFFLAKEASVKLWGGYSVMIYCKKNG